MESRFVRPDTDTLTLANGDTLVVRRRLNSGEHRAMLSRLYLPSIDGAFRANPLQIGLATVTAYLLDWSLTDPQGKPVVIEGLSIPDLEKRLDELSPQDFKEIREAIEAHDEAKDAERTAAKKILDGGTKFAATSPSPSAVGGASNGSESLTETTLASSLNC